MGLGQSKIDKTLNKGMKKTIKFMKLLSLIIATLITFSSCERTVFDQENELAGSWEGEAIIYSAPDHNWNIVGAAQTICFYEEGAGLIYYALDMYPSEPEPVFKYTDFIYSINEKQIYYYDQLIKIEEVNKETLILSHNGVKKEFKRKK